MLPLRSPNHHVTQRNTDDNPTVQHQCQTSLIGPSCTLLDRKAWDDRCCIKFSCCCAPVYLMLPRLCCFFGTLFELVKNLRIGDSLDTTVPIFATRKKQHQQLYPNLRNQSPNIHHTKNEWKYPAVRNLCDGGLFCLYS